MLMRTCKFACNMGDARLEGFKKRYGLVGWLLIITFCAE